MRTKRGQVNLQSLDHPSACPTQSISLSPSPPLAIECILGWILPIFTNFSSGRYNLKPHLRSNCVGYKKTPLYLIELFLLSYYRSPYPPILLSFVVIRSHTIHRNPLPCVNINTFLKSTFECFVCRSIRIPFLPPPLSAC